MGLTLPQKQVIDCKSRFRVLISGRRFGKTFVAINELAKFARIPNRKVWYVAPSYRQAKSICWVDLKDRIISHNWHKKINDSDLSILLKNNSRLLFPSSNDFFNPFKEVYFEIDGFNNNGKSYYKFGFSSLRDILELYENQQFLGADLIPSNRYSYELRSAYTLPITYTYRLTDNRSVDFIFEYQDLKKGIIRYDNNLTSEQFSSNFSKPSQINRYINLGYSYSPKWSMNFSIDYTDSEEKIVLDTDRHNNSLERLISKLFNDELTWASVGITYNFKQDHRFSLSYGSKRGGVYCSNGICRYMQPFENGFIFKIISSF